MAKTLDTQKALERAQRLCSLQEKCISDVKLKLIQWGANTDDITGIIKQLVESGFINEQRFALSFARDKANGNHWGPKKIEMALRTKRISDELIQLALEDVEPLTDNETLGKLLSKKLRSLKYKNIYDLKNKMLRFGVSRGFNYGDVRDETDKIIRDLDLTEDSDY
ncbi:MAG: regulatory protein RecX [Tenuifilaceae bacterium]|nr:regulatory protein RecX [Tenuifilaceae bacterium]